MKAFLNQEEMYEFLLGLCKEVAEDYEGDYEEECESWASVYAQQNVEDMYKYVHRKDTKMYGNFCNIREDWEECYGFIGSEVQPWGKFDDMVASVDNGTISEEDMRKVQTWCMDWFLRAFGTWGIQYNFGEYLSELEYEREREIV